MSVVGTELQALPIDAMIGGPLAAAIRAQGLAAQTTAEFIQNVGLDPSDSGYKARIVSFDFQRSKEDPYYPGVFTTEYVSLNVPLLAIVPIPFIRISDMNITFEFSIKNTEVSQTSQQKRASVEAKAKGGFAMWSASVKINASYTSETSTRSETNRSATLRITVNAVQDRIPEGLSRVLDMLNNAIVAVPKST